MAMELTDLTVFLEVAQQGSFSRAAGVLRLAQPSVSTRMAALERSIGTALFARSARGVTLTSAGRALEPYARRCLAMAEEARLTARVSAGSQRLVMVSPPTLAPIIFPPLIPALAVEPLEVICRTAHSHEVVEQLADGAAHLGFLQGTSVPDGLSAERLYSVPIIWVARPDHPAAGARPRRLADLAEHRLAVHPWGPSASELDELLRAARMPPTKVCWVSPAATALALALEHDHIAVLPADAARPALRSGRLAPVNVGALPKWSLHIAAAYRHSDKNGPAALALRALAATGIQAKPHRRANPTTQYDAQPALTPRRGQAPSGQLPIISSQAITPARRPNPGH
jgi:DNA-binding transcriptional LysR family regulator